MKKFLYEIRFFLYGAILGAILSTVFAMIGIATSTLPFMFILIIIIGIIITPFIPKLDEKVASKYFKGVK